MEQQLKIIFGDCKRIANSGCTIGSSYEQINVDTFYVFDPPNQLQQPSRIVTSSEEYQLIVKNVDTGVINFVKTDKCLFTQDVSKCDCLLFNDEKLFFVEIKSSSPGTRKDKRKEAVQQLEATITYLKANNIDFSQFVNKKAIICFKHVNNYPVKASANSQRAIFLANHGIDLEEGNEIEF